MTVESDLLTGIAQFLNDEGLAVYKPAGGYLATDVAVVFGELPTAPDTAVGLTIYGSSDEVKQNLSRYRMQIWTRGAANNSLGASAIASPIFDALQGREEFWLGSVYVIQTFRASFVPMGIDANKRYERSDNYVFDVNTPATSGRPE